MVDEPPLLLAGDWTAAPEVQLVWPETGMCSSNPKPEHPVLDVLDRERLGGRISAREAFAPTRNSLHGGRTDPLACERAVGSKHHH